MNFQLHMPHGVLLFLLLAVIVSFVGFKVGRLVTRKDRESGTGEGRMTAGLVGCYGIVLAAICVIAAIIMAFTTPYAAYAALAAIFFLFAAFGS